MYNQKIKIDVERKLIMKITDFKKQIEEDIKIIKNEYIKNEPQLEKDEYAFNYWILTKLFSVDEEIAFDYITEYSDDGCDCYVFFEDARELYIIQNKYYGDDTRLSDDYVAKDFLVKPINSLYSEKYKRSQKLQDIFTKYKSEEEFKIFLYLYITNNNVSDTTKKRFENYKNNNNDIKAYIEAKLFTINDIHNAYYGDRKENVKDFSYIIKTRNDGTTLNINTKDYKLPTLTDAKYIMTPVKSIFEMIKYSQDKDYVLFSANIREYLGNKGVNINIAKTLNDKDDRDKFFYYNNGITIICDSVEKKNVQDRNNQRGFEVKNPQIVNGCQTVNTIYEVLNKYNDKEIDKEFKNTFVMVKLLILDKNNEDNKQLYSDIVRYNNSQNAISDKDFAKNQEFFANLQKELKKFGFLLSIKQSDKFQIKEKEKFNDYRQKLENYEKLFNIEFKKIDDIIIDLEKFMQVILAFSKNGYEAFTKKSQLLKIESETHKHVINYIKNGDLTHGDLINLYILFIKAEKDKKQSEDKRTPIPFYVLGFLGKELYNLEGDDLRHKFRFIFKSKENFEVLYEFYKKISKKYKFRKKMDYNQMIKIQIDDTLLQDIIIEELDTTDKQKDKDIIEEYLK